MYRFLIFFVSLLLVSNKPISLEDRELKVLYVCNLDGNYSFDSEGRGSVATISELKRRELETIAHGRGNVFLFGNGNFFKKVDVNTLPKAITSMQIFDGFFLSEPELSHLEEIGLSEKSHNFLSHRENAVYIPGERIYNLGNYKVLFSNISKRIEKKLNSKSFDLSVVFLPEGELPGEDSFQDTTQPIVYIFSSPNNFQYTFHKKQYYAECPSSGKVGKLTLFFRDGRIIRNHHEFISLNEMDRNNSWIKPDRKILKELEK
jgi:hypothetical protein